MENKSQGAIVQRNSSMELLRILSIIMIIFHHFSCHGTFDWMEGEATAQHLWYSFISIGGKIGTNAFVLISGYYLINDNNQLFNIKKILKYIGQLLFYSIGLYCLYRIFRFRTELHPDTIETFAPIIGNSWWFASTYFLLYVFHPFINIALKNIDKNTYQSLLLFLALFWPLVYTVTSKNHWGSSLMWFIYLYSIAGYIRLYGVNEKLSSKKCFAYFIITVSITFLLGISQFYPSPEATEELDRTFFYQAETIPIFIASIMLFLTFERMEVKYNKCINTIASASFGVYLIHDHISMRSHLWGYVFGNPPIEQEIGALIVYSFVAVFSVYIVCVIIDLVRKYVFEYPIMELIDEHEDDILKNINNITDKLKKRMF